MQQHRSLPSAILTVSVLKCYLDKTMAQLEDPRIETSQRRPTGYVFHGKYMRHDSGDLAFDEWMQQCRHWEQAETKKRMHNLISSSGLLEKLTTITPRQATEAELCYFHTREYVDRVKILSAGKGGEVGDETRIAAGGYAIAALAAGGAIVAVDQVMSGACANAYTLVRPPGHHATRSSGAGFCVFNNVVVAAEHALRKWSKQVKRIAIIDFDAHHGNGTQDAFDLDDRVLFISVHQNNNYPAKSGAVDDNGSTDHAINVPLPAGSGSVAYAMVMQSLVTFALRAYEPDLILASCGFDASYMDPLARMMLGSKDVVDITNVLLQLAETLCEGRLVMIHEGGYSDLYVPYCGLAVLEALSGEKTGVVDPMLEEQRSQDGGLFPDHQVAVIKAAREVADRLIKRYVDRNLKAFMAARDDT